MIFRVVFYGAAGVAGAILGLWSVDREPPTVTLRAEPMTQTVVPGGDLKIKFSVRRTKSCVTHIDRLLLDSQKARFLLPDLDYAKAPGPMGDDEYVSVVPIPEQMAGGPARYRTIASYQCNIIHRLWPVTLDPIDVPFTVTP